MPFPPTKDEVPLRITHKLQLKLIAAQCEVPNDMNVKQSVKKIPFVRSARRRPHLPYGQYINIHGAAT